MNGIKGFVTKHSIKIIGIFVGAAVASFLAMKAVAKAQLKKRQKEFLQYVSKRNSIVDQEHKSPSPLKKAEALVRKQCLSNVRYELTLLLLKGDQYEGIITIHYNIENTSDGIYLDYGGKELKRVKINDSYIDASKYFYRHRFLINKEYQNQGANKITLEFKNDYSTNGYGLHHYTDPADKNEYIYTHFEPFFANRAFPCFDQPDLKGPFKLSVIAPKEWNVISNQAVVKEDPDVNKSCFPVRETDYALNDYKLTEFKETLKLSTYLYSCIAGPYKIFECSENMENQKDAPKENASYNDNLNYVCPLRIVCRSSYAKYVENILYEMFDISIKGMKFYQNYFKFRYPFGKYDQVFIPEFPMGAMENPGSVTFNEAYLFKDKPTERQISLLAITLLHEMSHMWFGDLVTMSWWDDLWLNESFATYISHYCMANEKSLKERYKLSWPIFLEEKCWALKEDQLASTHSILAQIDDTEEATTSFDGITYGKGACTMKQLTQVTSEKIFNESLINYFARHKFSNTTLKLFLQEFDNLLPKDKVNIFHWSKQWLETKGASILTPEVELDADGKVSSFKIIQEFTSNADIEYRVHIIDIAVYDEAFNETIVHAKVNSEKVTEVSALVGMKAKAFLLNANDLTYAKCMLDNASYLALKEQEWMVQDMVNKKCISIALWNLIIDGKYKAAEYLDYTLLLLANDTDMSNIMYTLRNALVAAKCLVKFEVGCEYMDKIFKQALQIIALHATNKPWCIQLLNEISYFIASTETRKQVINWLTEGKFVVKDDKSVEYEFAIPFSFRSIALPLIYADRNITIQEKEQLFNAIFKDEKSDDREIMKLKCQSAIPDESIKLQLFNSVFITKKQNESLLEIESKLLHLMYWEHTDLQQKMIPLFLEKASHLTEYFTHEEIESLVVLITPLIPHQDILAKLDEIIESSETTVTFRKACIARLDLLKRIEKQLSL